MASGAPGWPFSAALGGYYWYDARTDTITLANGRHFPRPESVPRETLLRQCPQNPQDVPFQYGGSPPRDPGYSLSGGNDTGASSAQTRPRRDVPSGPQDPPIVTSRQPSIPMQSQRTQLQDTRSPVIVGSAPARVQSNTMANIEERLSGLDVQAAPQSSSQSSSQPSNPSAAEMPRPVTAMVRRDQGGETYFSTQDPRSHVRTVWQSGPADRITDPYFLSHGVTAKMRLIGTDDDEERLFASFKKPPHAARFFKVGKVFMMLWVEPAGESAVTYLQAGESTGRFGERVYSKVRRFVVIREGQGYCSALPITTYGRRGVSKPGVVKSEHAIIYTGKAPGPAPLRAELPGRGEEGMRPRAIRVDPDQKDDSLDVLSRIDFGKVTTVQHNIKAKSFGMVNRASLDALEQQAKNVWWKAPEKRDDDMSGTVYSRMPDPPEPSAPTRAFIQGRVPSSTSAESGPSSRARDSVLSNTGSVSGVAVRRPSQASSVPDTISARTASQNQSKSTVIRRPVNESSSEEDDSEDSEDDDDDDQARAPQRPGPNAGRGSNTGQPSSARTTSTARTIPANQGSGTGRQTASSQSYATVGSSSQTPSATRPSMSSQVSSSTRQPPSSLPAAASRPPTTSQAATSGRQTSSSQAPSSNRQPVASQPPATSRSSGGAASSNRAPARRCTRHGVEGCRTCFY